MEPETRIEENHVNYFAEDFTNKVEEELCSVCGGTGEVDVLGSVYPGEPHMAYVETRVCDCKLNDEE